jgi:hypothetical protein
MLAPDLLTVTANGLQVIDNKTIDRRYVVLPIGAMRRPGAPSRKPAANRLAPTWYGQAARIVTSVQKRSIVCNLGDTDRVRGRQAMPSWPTGMRFVCIAK